jgi:hypothetical protein
MSDEKPRLYDPFNDYNHDPLDKIMEQPWNIPATVPLDQQPRPAEPDSEAERPECDF